MDPKRCCSRRDFIFLSAGTIVALSSGSACTSGGGDTTAGSTADLQVGGARVTADNSAVVMRDSQGIYAMSLICTHAGCNMSGGIGASRISCSCHGSAFDSNGNVLSGPATSPLPHLSVTVDANHNITVHTGQTVSSSLRVPA